MKLAEISGGYAESAAILKTRIQELRTWERAAKDPETALRLRQRINILTAIWRETKGIAALTAHYYRRGA